MVSNETLYVVQMYIYPTAHVVIHTVSLIVTFPIVTLTSKDGATPFKGFLIQAVSLYDGSKLYGKFINLSDYVQYLNCSEIESLPYKVRSEYKFCRVWLFCFVL